MATSAAATREPSSTSRTVFFCCHEPVWPLTGGSTNGNLAILHQLKAAGLDPVAVTPYNGSREEAERAIGVRLLPFRPFYMHRSASLRTLRYAAYSVMYLFFLLWAIRREKPSLLLCRNTVLALPVHIASRLTGVPSATLLADMLSYFFWHQPTEPPLWQRLFRRLECHLATLHDRIFVITEVMADEITQFEKKDIREKIAVIRDGVHDRFQHLTDADYEAAREIRASICGDAPLAVFYGTLELHHGMHEIIEIVPLLLERAPDFHVLIIGGGPCQPMLMRSPLASHPRVHLLDFLSHDPLIRHALAADVGMIPYPAISSTHMIYTFKFLEYHCLGLPIVAFPLETLRREFSRLPGLYLAKDYDDFVDAVIRLGRERKRYPADDEFRRRFSWEQVAAPVVNEALKRAAER